MILQAYLDRIGYKGELEVSLEALRRLHEHHLFTVPFENLDIHNGKEIFLEEKRIYKKVVEKYRGGFCYELNLLFHALLSQIGFESKIIAARIFDDEGEMGPAFDHMCLLIELTQPWLVDVGFGDLFLQPIALEEDEVQTDRRNYFKVERYADQEYVLLMSADRAGFSRKYTFSTKEQPVSDFASLCKAKQTDPHSYFVKNKVCTRPTVDGRITLFNRKFIHKVGEHKFEYQIEEEQHYTEILKSQFNISME